MEIENIKNRKQFIRYMKPYGNHVKFIIGNYYAIKIDNVEHDMFTILKYDENYDKKNSKRLYVGGCKPIETIKANAEDCVNLIMKVVKDENFF